MSSSVILATPTGANGTPIPISAANPLPVNATVTATANTVATATAAAPTYVEGTVNPLSMDLTGGMRITGTINATSAATATTAAPSYVNATSNPFSQNLSGDLRVIAKQSGTWTVGLSAGSALVGSVSIDQTTNGVTNAVDILNMPTVLDVNSGVKSNNTLRFVLATDQPQLTNALKVDGSAVTQPVSGTVTANFGTIAGVATAAKQPALGTAGASSTDVISIQGIASGTALAVSGTFWQATQPVSGTFWQATQPVSGTFWQTTQPVSFTMPALVAGSAIIGKVGIDQTTPGTTNLIAAGQNGTWTVQPGNTPNTAPWLVGHGKTIKTATVNITADTDIVAAVTSKRIKVIAYALFKTGTGANPILFKSNGTGGTEVARILLQSQASAVFGANLSIAAPSFLFATVAGEKLTMDVGDSDTLTGFITYFDDDAT